MEILISLDSILFFILTVGLGLLFGYKCYCDGRIRGEESILCMLQEENFINIDDEGNISKVK